MKVLALDGSPIFEQNGVLFADVEAELIEQGVDTKNVVVLYSKDEIREIRKPLLVDADFMVNIALDKGDAIAEQKARVYRQKLRDMTLPVGNYIPLVIPVK